MTLTYSTDIAKKYRPVLIMDFGVMEKAESLSQAKVPSSKMTAHITQQVEMEIYEAFCLDRCINVCKTSGSDFPCLKRLIASGSKKIE